jgi:hypothetical protein
MGRPVKDIANQRYGRLVAMIPMPERDRYGSVKWLCDCDCGQQIIVSGQAWTH